MVSVVFVIGMLNLALGFALAVMLERQTVLYIPRFRTRGGRGGLHKSKVSARGSSLNRVPEAWLERLSDGDLDVTTLAEAAAHVVKRDAEKYREDLLDIEDLILSAMHPQSMDEGKAESLPTTIEELILLNEQWQAQQCDFVRVLTEQRADTKSYAPIGDQIEKELLHQMPLIDTHCQNVKNVDPEQGEEVLEIIIREVGHLVALVHRLRDAMQDTLAILMRDAGRLGTVEPDQFIDPLTGLEDRLGLEVQFHNWWEEDVESERLASVALLDIDRFSETNECVATRVGDRVLASLGQYLAELTGADGSPCRAYRYSGQQFLLFFQDKGPNGAADAVEHLRQAVQATTFEHEGTKFALTFRAGVTDVVRGDDTGTLLNRLQELTNQVQEGSRDNRICLDEGDGPRLVEPQEHSLAQRVITIEPSHK